MARPKCEPMKLTDFRLNAKIAFSLNGIVHWRACVCATKLAQRAVKLMFLRWASPR